MNKVKQVIVARTDLNMRKGKLAAQVAHASLAVILDRMRVPQEPFKIPGVNRFITQSLSYHENSELDQWLNGKFTKIVVGVNSEQELLNVYQQAKDAGLFCSLIKDAGDTEFHGVPTYTTCAIGPNYAEKIDLITGGLKLL